MVSREDIEGDRDRVEVGVEGTEEELYVKYVGVDALVLGAL
jgi:hypothetical protein